MEKMEGRYLWNVHLSAGDGGNRNGGFCSYYVKARRTMIIRNETRADRRAVEELIRRAFYNLYVPGCVEHYLAHVMREHEDFIPELDFVAELDGQIIGNIMYTKARLVDEGGAEKEILTFGPVCIAPEYQRNLAGTRPVPPLQSVPVAR